MSTNKHLLLFGLLVLLAGLYKVLEILSLAPPLLQNYLEDLLAIPIILSTALLIIQMLIPGQRSYILSRLDIVVITLLFSIYFEAVLPIFNAAFTSDGIDVLCYCFGAWVFAVHLNRPLTHSSSLSERRLTD